MSVTHAAIFDDLTALVGCDTEPHAPVARAPRADRVGALRGAAAPAIDGQPPSQDAGGRRLGRARAATARAATTRWRCDDARRADAASVGCAARSGRLVRRAPIRTRGGSRASWRAGRRKSEEFFASSAGQWDRLRQELFGRASSLSRAAGAVRSAVGRRRPRLRHGPDQRSGGAVCRAGSSPSIAAARCCRPPGDGCAISRTSTSAAASSRRCHCRRRARRRDHDARAAPRAGSAGGAPRDRARAPARRPARARATCCRTTARSTSSRWATSGSGLPKISFAAC